MRNIFNAAIFASLATFSPSSTAQPFAYVSSYELDNVSVINRTTGSVQATISTGVSPSLMSYSPDGSRLYVVTQGPSLATIRTSDNTLLDTIFFPIPAFSAAVTPDGSKAFVTFPAFNQVGVYNMRTKAQLRSIPVEEGPYRIAMHPDGDRVYVTSSNGRNLVVIDTTSHRVVRNIPIGHTGTGIAMAPDGSHLFVSTQFPGSAPDEGPGAIWSIDTRRNQVAGNIRGYFGDALAISRNGTRLYGMNDVGLAVMRPDNLTMIENVPLQGFVNGIAVGPAGERLYMVFPLENVTKVFATDTRSIVGSIPTPGLPYDVAIPAPALPRRPIYPFGCVRRLGDQYEAVFGYINEGVAREIPIGPDNRVSPAPENRGQPAEFIAGLKAIAFRVQFDGQPLTWRLDGPDGIERSSVVSRNSFPCPN